MARLLFGERLLVPGLLLLEGALAALAQGLQLLLGALALGVDRGGGAGALGLDLLDAAARSAVSSSSWAAFSSGEWRRLVL